MNFQRGVVAIARSHSRGGYREAKWETCTYTAIQVSVALLVLLWIVYPLRTVAATPDLETVLASTHKRIETLDYRVTGKLTRVEGNGTRTSYRFVSKGHWFPDGMRLLYEITDPVSARTRILLHMSVSGRVTIEVILPGEQVAKALPFERWNDSLLGTDFSYEDLVEEQFFWKNQELLAAGKYGARDCFVLKSVPGIQDRSYYDSVTSWIDRSILYPVHVVKILRGTGQQKEFIYYGLRQTGGAWSASQVEAQTQSKPGSSLFIIEGGSGKAKLLRKNFDLGLPDTDAAK